MNKKLTQAQQKVLDQLLKPGAYACYTKVWGWILSSNYKPCAKEIESLVNLGLAKFVKESECVVATQPAALTSGKAAR